MGGGDTLVSLIQAGDHSQGKPPRSRGGYLAWAGKSHRHRLKYLKVSHKDAELGYSGPSSRTSLRGFRNMAGGGGVQLIVKRRTS